MGKSARSRARKEGKPQGPNQDQAISFGGRQVDVPPGKASNSMQTVDIRRGADLCNFNHIQAFCSNHKQTSCASDLSCIEFAT